MSSNTWNPVAVSPLEAGPPVQAEHVLSALPIAVCLADREGRMLHVNHRAAELFGQAVVSQVGQPLHDALGHLSASGARCDDASCPVRTSLLERGPSRLERQPFAAGEASLWFDWLSAPWSIGPTEVTIVVLRDVTALTRQELVLRQRQQVMNRAQQLARLGVWEYDLETDRITWSPQLYDIFGIPEGTSIDFASYMERIHPDDRARLTQYVQDAIAGRRPYSVQHRIVRADGEIRVMLGMGEAVMDSAGTPIRLIGTGQDITERVQAERRAFELAREKFSRERAEAERERLKRVNRELDQFAYIASHDLKAPLRGIANLAQWIEEDLDGTLRDSTRDMLALMRSRMHRLEALINGLLEFSRAGRLRQPPERVDAGELAADVIELLSPPATTRILISPDLPVLFTERLALQQVFLNLVSNAVKYTQRPDAEIRIDAIDKPDDTTFVVSDNGPGIAPEFHEKVWGIFQTLQSKDRVDGTGIGLALVKKIVETRGGSVGLESAEGQGARFSFTWPKHMEIED